jgi:hypothetical protein
MSGAVLNEKRRDGETGLSFFFAFLVALPDAFFGVDSRRRLGYFINSVVVGALGEECL